MGTTSCGWLPTGKGVAIALAFVTITLFPSDAGACTTLCIRDANRIVFGQNYDWYVADGAVLVNKRGVSRTAWAPRDKALQWKSRYGSVTFNQYGRGNPIGGMNEAGLVVAMMWVIGTSYPVADARPAVGSGVGWIQYQLDTARTVSEVIASDARTRISAFSAQLHYLVADRSGDVAVIEFREGKMLVRQGNGLPVAALANDFYDDSLVEFERLKAAGALGPDRIDAAPRFVRASARAAAYRTGTDPVRYVFDTLHEVAQGKEASSIQPPAHITQWSVVYELDRLQVHFRTRQQPAIKTIAFGALDFACGSPVAGMDVHQAESGNANSRLRPFTRAQNVALVESTWSQTAYLRLRPREMLESSANTPYEAECVQ